jgi:hypothetical protein
MTQLTRLLTESVASAVRLYTSLDWMALHELCSKRTLPLLPRCWLLDVSGLDGHPRKMCNHALPHFCPKQDIPFLTAARHSLSFKKRATDNFRTGPVEVL